MGNQTKTHKSEERILTNIKQSLHTLLCLPDEVVLLIFSYLKPIELAVVCRTCYTWLQLGSEEFVWQRICSRYGLNKDPFWKWKETFINCNSPLLPKYRPNKLVLLSSSLCIVKKRIAKKLRAVDNLNLSVLGCGGVGRDAAAIRYVVNRFKKEYCPVLLEAYTQLMDLDGSQLILDIEVTAASDKFSGLWSSQITRANGFLIGYSILSQRSFAEVEQIIQQYSRNTSVSLN